MPTRTRAPRTTVDADFGGESLGGARVLVDASPSSSRTAVAHTCEVIPALAYAEVRGRVGYRAGSGSGWVESFMVVTS
jgi:hypothetical protein